MAGHSGRGATVAPAGTRRSTGERLRALVHHAPVETWVIGFTILLWVAVTLAAPTS